MPSRAQVFWNALAVFVIAAALFALVWIVHETGAPQSAAQSGAAVVSAGSYSFSTSTLALIPFPIATSSQAVATSSPQTPKTSSKIVPIAPTPEANASPASTGTTETVATQNTYSTPPESFDTVNSAARAALVNILCMPRGGGSLHPISGSGVIIDPRGIILTNAHVAQYVLLSESSDVDLSCSIRSGSPATAQWTASVLYIPPIWIAEHAGDINEDHPTGTGEHDYALLYITGAVNGGSTPSQFPYLPYDVRPTVGFEGNSVLVASYPAEFLGAIAAENNLYPDSSISSIGQLFTFGSGSADVFSVGGVIEAQSGSSGGAVVNQWGNLVGLIATVSDGSTTEDRDLRAISLSYINSDLAVQTGTDLATLLAGDPSAELQDFNQHLLIPLLQPYIAELSNE